MTSAKLSSRNQIVLPKEARDILDVGPGEPSACRGDSRTPCEVSQPPMGGRG